MSGRHGGDGETVGWLRGQLTDMARRLRRADEECARLRAELAEAEQHIRAQSEVDRILAMGFSPAANGDTGPIARVPGPRAAGHRAPRDRHGMRLVPGLVPLAAFAKGAHAWVSSHVALTAAGAATVAVPAALGVALTCASPASAAHQAHPAALPPAASLWTATPITSPAGKPKAAVARDGHLVTAAPSPYPYAAAPPSSTAPARSSPAPSSLPPVPQLTLPATLNLGVYLSTAIEISNPQDQAVPWSVTCGADVSVSPSQGVLEPGQQNVQLQVSINPIDLAAGALCTFTPGGEVLRVTWAGAGTPSSLGL